MGQLSVNDRWVSPEEYQRELTREVPAALISLPEIEFALGLDEIYSRTPF
jgi:hypothetical protein